jgi:predicted ABC-type ATPase
VIEGCERLLDPDAIARTLNPLHPEAAAIAAGREVLTRTAEYLSQGVSFAVETTLSGRGRLDLIDKAKSRGYEVRLIFVGLDSPERCVTRVRNRFARGGHSVPEEDVRRRYDRSVANALKAIRDVDAAEFYDNSGEEHRFVLATKAGEIVWRADPLPAWLKLY